MNVSMRNTRGMTLIEVIVAAALIVVGVMSLVAALGQSSVFSERIDTTYTASYLAQRRIDTLKVLDFGEIALASETDVRIDNTGNVAADGGYLRTTEITEDYDSNVYLVKVKVTVKKLKINIDGTILDPDTGEMTFLGQPVIMETIFCDIE